MSFRDWYWRLRKDAPAAGDVHVSSTGSPKAPKRPRKPAEAPSSDDEDGDSGEPVAPPMNGGTISQTAVLPVTNPTQAAGVEDPSRDAKKPMGKANDFELPVKVEKIDAEQRLIFGWASVSEQDGKLVIDKQGDMILPEDLEKAAYDFVLFARQHGEMHEKIGTGRLVESMMFTKEKQAALGIDLKKVGWWTGFKIDDDATWAAHKNGKLPEFSIGGSGRRVDA